jgi:hypothetical protein
MHMYPLHSLFLMPVLLQITATVHNKAHHLPCNRRLSVGGMEE